jgi:hypothetical protein
MSEDRTQLVSALQRAIDSGGHVRVRYFAGSSPGAERVLSPITLTERHITAKPAGQYQVKRFLLEEIELVIDGQPSKRLPVDPSSAFPDMLALGQHVASLLRALGWHVVATPFEISVHRRRKNGIPLKASELTMSFTERETRKECDIEGNLTETTFSRSRPYSINGVAFSDFAKAQVRMNELATALTNRHRTTP